jgi:hypothetical protein
MPTYSKNLFNLISFCSIDDIILSVNGVNVEHVEHSFVIRLLKEAKEFIHLVIKRKICNNTNNGTVTSTQLTNTTSTNNNNINSHNNSTISNSYQQINPNDLMSKRHNMAIQQTAATVMSNYCNQNVPSSTSENGSNDQVTSGIGNGCNGNGNDLMSNMMNSTSSMSSMKPFKLTLNRKDNKKEQFGIVLGCKYYIKDILPGSIAASMEPAGLIRRGDILLKLNDFTYEQMSLYQANKIIAKTKENKLNLLIKRVNNLNGGQVVVMNQCDDFDLLECDQVDSASNALSDGQINEQQPNMVENTNAKQENGKTNHETEQLINEKSESAAPLAHQYKSPFKPIFKPLRQQQHNEKKSTYASGLPLNCRTAVFARENGIGIRLAGGNKVGIFICDVQYNSPAEKAGLKIADKILKVNGVDYEQLTREEAVQHILSLQTLIEMMVVHSPEEYESFAFDPIGGDSFYIRAHFNFESKRPTDLSFKINDILHVTDTLYNGVIGQWVATKLPSMNEQLSEKVNQDDLRGTIPNLANAEHFVQSAQTIDDKYNNAINSTSINLTSMKSTVASNALSLGASARMSLRKKLAGRGALNKRSKSASRSNGDLDTVSNSTDLNDIQVVKRKLFSLFFYSAIKHNQLYLKTANTFNSNKNQVYERVVLREVNFVRPVVLFGPLADVAREKLKSEAPSKYEIPDSYSTDPNEATQSSGVIKLATIKQIMERNRHCLLDITPNAVDHLNYAQYFPICIYLRSQSKNHTKELRQKYAKNLRAKSSRRLHENAMKLNDFYSHLFTCTVNLDSNQWFKQIKEAIEEQQNEPIWVSEDLDRLLNEQADLVDQKMQALGNTNTNAKQILDQIASTPNNYSNQTHMIMKPTTTTGHSTHLNYFDDNFEFPIYTTANMPLSMSGAASSTYSLYEENNYNRSSFAASDSDICSSSAFQSKPSANESTTQIYSTNFNNNRLTNSHHHQPLANNSSMILTGAVPVLLSSDNTSSPTVSTCSLKQANGVLHRVHSDPNLAIEQQQQQHAQLNGKHQQALLNSSVQYQANHAIYPQYKQTTEGQADWKKYATYSAHSLKNMTKQQQQQQQQLMNGNYVSNKSRASLTDSLFMTAHGESRRLSTTSNDYSNNSNSTKSNMRNSSSYSSYKLIKNSQSSLMPSHNKTIVDHPLLMASSNDSNKINGASFGRNVSSGSLLQPIINENELVSKIGEMHLQNGNGLNESPQALKEKLKQELASKLAEKNDSIDARNANAYVNSLVSSSSSANQANLILNSDVKAKRELFNNLSNQQRAPPTLPKPKFILPQTPTTNLVLQRNLKSKSELNIATTPNSFSASTSSSESSPSANKNSAQSSSNSTSTSTTGNQKHQQALKNKHLENSSTVSSSQGYHSDSWDSHSSRQSFDTDSQNTITTGNNQSGSNRFKNLLKATSKLASVSSSNTQMNGKTSRSSLTKGQKMHIEHTTSVDQNCSSASSPLILNQNILEKPTTSGSSSASSTLSTTSTHSNSSSTTQNSSSSQSSCVAAISDATTISSNSSNSFANNVSTSNGKNRRSSQINQNDAIELPIYYEQSNSHKDENIKSPTNTTPSKAQMSIDRSPNMEKNTNNNSLVSTSNNYSPFKEIYTSDSAKIRIMTYTAHYNDNGIYRKLSLDSNSNCSIIASANGIFDCNGGILESADTGVSLNVPEGAIAKGCSFDLYFKVCHCKSHITNGKGEPLTNPIVMCGPRGIKFLKPIELVIPHFITLDGQSWSYAFKTAEPNGSFSEDPYCWNVLRFHKKTLINSVTVLLDSF